MYLRQSEAWTYGKDAWGNLNVDCHDFDMILYMSYLHVRRGWRPRCRRESRKFVHALGELGSCPLPLDPCCFGEEQPTIVALA